MLERINKVTLTGLVLFLICGMVYIPITFARMPNVNWKIVTPTVDATDGTTTLVTGVSGAHIVVKNMLFLLKNASSMYLGWGSNDQAISKLTPQMHFTANGGWDKTDSQSLDIIVPKGESLKVWFSADPGADVMVNYTLEYTST